MALSINSTAEFIPVDTRSASGTIVLPLVNAIRGRILTFKDMYGSFSIHPLMLSTQFGNSFEDGATTKEMRNTFGYLTLVSNGQTQWNILDGTELPMYTISSLRTNTPVGSSNIIGSSNVTVENLLLLDKTTSDVYEMVLQNGFLYYGSNIVAGTKTGSAQFLSLM